MRDEELVSDEFSDEIRRRASSRTGGRDEGKMRKAEEGKVMEKCWRGREREEEEKEGGERKEN